MFLNLSIPVQHLGFDKDKLCSVESFNMHGEKKKNLQAINISCRNSILPFKIKCDCSPLFIYLQMLIITKK